MFRPYLLCNNRRSLSDLCLSQHSSLLHGWLQKDLQTGPLHYSPGSQSSHADSVQTSPKLLPETVFVIVECWLRFTPNFALRHYFLPHALSTEKEEVSLQRGCKIGMTDLASQGLGYIHVYLGNSAGIMQVLHKISAPKEEEHLSC